MPPPTERVPVSRLRAALAARAAETSRRRTADEVGLSPQGLGNFLAGANPHPSTMRKMERWYTERVHESSTAYVSVEEALSILAQGFPLEDRAAVVAETKAFLRELYQRRGYPVPADLGTAQ